MGDPLSVTASIVAVLQMTATVTQYLKDVKEGAEDRIRLRDEMRSTMCLLEMLKDRIEDLDTIDSWADTAKWLDIPNGPLIQFQESLKLLTNKLAPSGRMRQIAQPLKWPFDKTEVKEALSRIERIKSLFSLAIQNDHIKLSRAIRSEVQEMSKGLEELRMAQQHQEQLEETRKILDWISSLRFWSKQNDVLSRKQEGTCEWFFQTAAFQNWLKGEGKTLWCPGIPGAGKTVLAATIINHIQLVFPGPQVGLAFIYCNYQEQDEQTPTHLLASLLRQLVERCVMVPREVQKLYQQHVGFGTSPGLLDYSQTLQLMAYKFSKIFLVIDALDECDPKTRSDLLREIRKLPPKLHLLCTSRDLRDIEKQFCGAARQEIRASSKDVEIYLQSSVEQHSRLKKHVAADPSLLDEITRRIVAKVDGMFLLAQLHIESLARKHDRKTIRRCLKELPTELDDMYYEALQRIYSQTKEDVVLAEKVLSWILFAFRPLSVKEVQHAIAVLNLEPDENRIDEEGLPDEELLVAVCGGMVTIDEENDTIHLIHYTAQQYFERVREVKFPHAQVVIAQACLRYLSLDAFTDSFCSSRKDMTARTLQHPLFLYAARNWGNHIEEGSEAILKSRILEFISNEIPLTCSIQAILLHHFSIETKPLGESRLWLVVGFGLVETMKALLEEGANIEWRGPGGETALQIAVRQGHAAMVRLLLNHKANIESRDNLGGTALQDAAFEGQEAILQLLIENGAEINATDDLAETALLKAAYHGHLGVARLLLENGADVNARSQYLSPLDAAAKGEHLAVVELLLKYNAHNFVDNKNRLRALFQAASSRAVGIFRPLLENCRAKGVHEDLLHRAEKVLAGCPARITCDACGASILDSETHYHCNICACGNFDLCQSCIDYGDFCFSTFHQLIQTTFVNEEKVAIAVKDLMEGFPVADIWGR